MEAQLEGLPSTPPASMQTLNAIDLATWLEDRAEPLGERWMEALRARDPGARTEGAEELLESFIELILELLPNCMTGLRDQADPLWDRTSELFGSFAANRGLAAGEAIEEVQILRESVIRLMYQDPPPPPSRAGGLREVLRLNRLADRLVTHASVGHTDSLFFALFQGSGAPEALSDEVRYELREQLSEIRTELSAITRHAEQIGPS